MATEVDTRGLSTGIGSRRAAMTSALAMSALAVAVFGPILYYMVRHWGQGPDYSHGFLIAPLSAYFIWERRKKIARTPIEPSWWGLVPLALGALALTIGRLGVEQMSMRVAFVLTLIGLQVLLLGIPISRVIAFPLFFLFVAEACSGMHSLLALGTLGILFAYFFRKSWPERFLLVASTIPIAILVNAFRVALTAVLTYVWGPQMADGAIHQTEGFFTFAMAFALLMLEATLVSLLLRAVSRWRKAA